MEAAAAAAARILVNFEASPHGGHWRPLPDSGREPAITMRAVIHHSIVGSAEGAFQYFAGATPIESTFIVKKSGYFWQWGQKWVPRPPITMRSMGVPQTRQGSPVRM